MEKLYGLERELVLKSATDEYQSFNSQVQEPREFIKRLQRDGVKLKNEPVFLTNLLEKLLQKQYLSSLMFCYLGSFIFYINQPQCQNYLEWEKEQASKQSQANTNIHISGSNNSIVTGSHNTINSHNYEVSLITQIEKDIAEKGGDDKQELANILNEIKALLQEWEKSKQQPSFISIRENLSNHISRHGWFYGSILQLVGNVAINN